MEFARDCVPRQSYDSTEFSQRTHIAKQFLRMWEVRKNSENNNCIITTNHNKCRIWMYVKKCRINASSSNVLFSMHMYINMIITWLKRLTESHRREKWSVHFFSTQKS